MSAAQMEYLVTKDKAIALKIFELGMKKFGDEPGYIMTYLDHLTHINGEHQHGRVSSRLVFMSVTQMCLKLLKHVSRYG